MGASKRCSVRKHIEGRTAQVYGQAQKAVQTLVLACGD